MYGADFNGHEIGYDVICHLIDCLEHLESLSLAGCLFISDATIDYIKLTEKSKLKIGLYGCSGLTRYKILSKQFNYITLQNIMNLE